MGLRVPRGVHTEAQEDANLRGFAIEGELGDPDGVCTAGNFVWRPAGTRHAAYTPEGGLMLAIFQVPSKFFERDDSVKDMLDGDWDEFCSSASNLQIQR